MRKNPASAMLSVVIVLLVVAMAGAARGATKAATWIAPPANLEDLGGIYGSRTDGFHVGGVTPGHDTLYPSRGQMLFDYCPSGRGVRETYACQVAWDGFYAWLQENRDGTMADYPEPGRPLP